MKLFRLEFRARGFLARRIALRSPDAPTPKINTRSQTDPGVNLASYQDVQLRRRAGDESRRLLDADHGLFQERHLARAECAWLQVGRRQSGPADQLQYQRARAGRHSQHADHELRRVGYGYYGYRGGMYAAGPIYGGTDVETVRYKQGTANIDVVDAAKKQLVWEGIAEGKITDKMMKNPQATIDGVITEMFANYPVKAGGGQ